MRTSFKIRAVMIVIPLLMTAMQRGECSAMQSNNEVRLYNDLNLPLEPATLTTMSEYNLSLCIFQTIFISDQASTPVNNVLDSYKYDPKTTSYEFHINPKVKWSDGRSLTSEDLALSILRLEKAAPGHFGSIDSLLRHEQGLKSLEKIDDATLRVRVNTPNAELFKRLTSAFIPIVRQDMLDPVTQKVNSNKVSIGPYVVEEEKKDLLILKKNDLFFKKRDNMPDRILMKPYPQTRVHANEILENKGWPNLILDRVFIEQKSWDDLKSKNAALWTRPIDRVMFMTPNNGITDSSEAAEIIRWLGYELSIRPLDFHEFPGVKKARALQPKGFVLFKPLEYGKIAMPKFKKKKYSIAIINNQLPTDYIAKYFKSLGLDADYEVFPVGALKEIKQSAKFDFSIGTVGAADPDPVTWLSLILQTPVPAVPDFSGAYKAEFERIKKEADSPQIQAEKLREFIYKAGIDGLYLPLAHFSSVAVASKNISFEDIWDTDETIDISRLIMRN